MTTSTHTTYSWLPKAFRDTALTVAMLNRHTAPSSFNELRERCRDQIQRLRAELKTDGQADDVIQDAVYAQCALLDEATLNHLKGQDRDAWEREPLQVVEFGTHDAGDALISRMQQRLRQPQQVRPLLAIFHAALSLGFHGRFALDGHDARAAMIRALGDCLGTSDASPGGVALHPVARWRGLRSLSLPVCVLASIAVAAVVWATLDRWLGAVSAQLLR